MEQLDYVRQAMELLHVVTDRCTITSMDWRDSVANRFQTEYVDKYNQFVHYFITGKTIANESNSGNSILGLGFSDLSNFLHDMSQKLSDIINDDSNDDMKVSLNPEDYFSRSKWDNEHPHKLNPASLDSLSLADIMNKRNH